LQIVWKEGTKKVKERTTVATGTPSAEGVIKFDVAHQTQILALGSWGEAWASFMGWRRLLFEVGVIGIDPQRYEGAGFGNMSFRLPPLSTHRGQRSFLITGTQTGGKETLALSDCAQVKRYDIRSNAITSLGETKPSSEALTHGAIYDLSPAIRFVFHGHVPALWHHAKTLGLPTTHPKVEYGTQDMALEMRRLYRDTNLSETRCLAMAGHEDGMIAFGRTAQEAGTVFVGALARSYALI
jgi:ribulose-5-phosphate 4-epimerase/fuculose-1-phosphate aldolase